jgi:type II secretory pathway pseudopilin PulG
MFNLKTNEGYNVRNPMSFSLQPYTMPEISFTHYDLVSLSESLLSSMLTISLSTNMKSVPRRYQQLRTANHCQQQRRQPHNSSSNKSNNNDNKSNNNNNLHVLHTIRVNHKFHRIYNWHRQLQRQIPDLIFSLINTDQYIGDTRYQRITKYDV